MNNYDYIIRKETKNDYHETEAMAREAFWNMSVPGCSEHYFIHKLRTHPAFIPELDYVIELDGKIIAAIMYSKSMIRDEDGFERTVLTMGPLCVHPNYQRKGYSKALLEFTFDKARELGYELVINFGNPDNYVARGYKSSKRFNICLQGDVFPSVLLVKELITGTLDGRKWYYVVNDSESCVEDEKAVEKYDRNFPPKEKGWQPSQEEFYIHSHSAITW